MADGRVRAEAFKEYEQAMDEAIPEIVADVRRRGALADEARSRVMLPRGPSAGGATDPTKGEP